MNSSTHFLLVKVEFAMLNEVELFGLTEQGLVIYYHSVGCMNEMSRIFFGLLLSGPIGFPSKLSISSAVQDAKRQPRKSTAMLLPTGLIMFLVSEPPSRLSHRFLFLICNIQNFQCT